VKYSSDPKTNRLRIIRRSATICLDGDYRINSSNYLEYWLNSPSAWRRQNNLPDKITFLGTWELTPQDDLQLRVDRTSYLPEVLSGVSRITINGKVIAAENNSLVFETQSTDSEGLQHVRLLKLSGSWGSDDANRISFTVSKRAAPDILTLSGSWSLNDNQQITYRFEKYDLKRKQKIVSTFEFSGYWRLTEANRLTYIISKGAGSGFDFKVQLETPNVYPQSGVIKYRLGSGIRRSRRGQPVIVCLYGEWKISRKLGLTFDMEYKKGEFHSLAFGAKVDITRKNRVEFSLINEKGATIGGKLICTHRFLKSLDGEFFVRLKKVRDAQGIDAGITIPF
jgi:hypothetical protein